MNLAASPPPQPTYLSLGEAAGQDLARPPQFTQHELLEVGLLEEDTLIILGDVRASRLQIDCSYVISGMLYAGCWMLDAGCCTCPCALYSVCMCWHHRRGIIDSLATDGC